jgi:hypothetical protein
MGKLGVEWLAKELESYGDSVNLHIYWEILDKLVKQAKEMERKRAIDFGYDIADNLACGVYRDKKAVEELYNEFFKSEQNDKT